MSDIVVQPLSLADQYLIMGLMDEEEQAWSRELDWDFAPIRRILFSFLEQRMLPGFVALSGSKALGYAYFLTSRRKSVIGSLYTSPPDAQTIGEKLLSSAIDALTANRRLNRIESQIIPVNGIDMMATFLSRGFEPFMRHYLELDLDSYTPANSDRYAGKVVPWNPSHLQALALVANQSYRNEIDAVICDDYASEASCEAYLRSLVENPGCGIFQASSSFVGLDGMLNPCGFILTSRISNFSAMISQISVDPANRGLGIGSALMRRALTRLKSEGYETVRLTVTQQNRRACEWYLRLGFRIRRDFHAYLWLRS